MKNTIKEIYEKRKRLRIALTNEKIGSKKYCQLVFRLKGLPKK